MINIDIDAFQETLQKMEALKTEMETQKENLFDHMNHVSRYWSGDASGRFQLMQTRMLENGLYAKTQFQISDMINEMNSILSKIQNLKVQCDSFDLCFDGAVPYKMGTASGEVMVSEDYVKNIKTNCDNIISEIFSCERQLLAIIRGCSDILDFCDCSELVQASCRKVEYAIEKLKEEIEKYTNGLVDVERYICVIF